jgi:hypothetical protein
MSCTDKFNATRKLREGDREKRERERERKWTELTLGSFTFEFGTVDIQSQLSNNKQTTISEAQKRQTKLFSYIGHNSYFFLIINIFTFSHKT